MVDGEHHLPRTIPSNTPMSLFRWKRIRCGDVVSFANGSNTGDSSEPHGRPWIYWRRFSRENIDLPLRQYLKGESLVSWLAITAPGRQETPWNISTRENREQNCRGIARRLVVHKGWAEKPGDIGSVRTHYCEPAFAVIHEGSGFAICCRSRSCSLYIVDRLCGSECTSNS